MLNTISSQLKKQLLSILGKDATLDKTSTISVYSAILLDEEEKNKISQAAGKLFGKTVPLEYHLDPKLLGGIKIVCGDNVVDLSLAEKLNTLVKEITKDHE